MATTVRRRAALAGMAGALARPAFALTPARGETPTLAASLAGYAASLRFADLGGPVVEVAKAHFIDAMGCLVGAFNEGPVRAVRALATSPGPATVLGTAVRTGPEWAAFANGTGIRFLDLNDSYAGRDLGHPSDGIAATLAVAEAENRSGRDMILATVLAYEVTCRLLDQVQISARGWDHPVFSLPAAALGAGVLMQLDPAQLVEAVNLSLAGSLGTNLTRLGAISNWKGMADADAARNAVFAAQLARAGVTGPAPAFEGQAGFFSQVSGPLAVDVAGFGGRGGTFRIAECTIKAYPAQVLLQTAIAAAAQAGQAVGDPAGLPGKVRSVVVTTSKTGHEYSAGSPEKWNPRTSDTADHSLPNVVARTLLDGAITPASYSPQALDDPRVHALLGRLTVEDDPALTAMYPGKMATRVALTLEDGRTVARQVDDLPGAGGAPITREATDAKFRRLARGVLPDAQVAAFLDAAWTLDRQDTLAGLVASLVVPA